MLNKPLISEIETVRLITEFLITGKCPPGCRPIVMEAIADLIAGTPKSFKPVLSGYRFKALKGSEVICFTNSREVAEKFGTVKQLYIRSVK